MKTSPWQKLGTFVAISALAVLVWVWADLAQPGTLETQPLELTIKLPEGLIVLKPLDAPMVRLKLSGPQREIDWLGDDIARKDNPWRPELTLAKPETGVPIEIDLTEELDMGDIKGRGLKIEGIVPAKIKLDIGAWEKITRPVSVNIDQARLTPGSLAVEPQSVEVLVLRRHKERAELLKLRTEQIALVDVAEDEPITEKPAILQTLQDDARGEEIPIKLLEISDVQVKFTVMPRALVTFGTLENVPVGVAGPPDVLDQHVVTFTDPNEAVLRQLKIKGTADAIKAVTQKRPEMLAYVIITQEDARRTQQGQTLSPHKVHLSLPPGIEIHEQPLDLTSVALKKRSP